MSEGSPEGKTADRSLPKHAENMTNEPGTSPRHIAILLFDGVEELDAVGPWEVLAHWTRNHPDGGWAVSCMSQEGMPVTASQRPGSGRTPRHRGGTTPAGAHIRQRRRHPGRLHDRHASIAGG